MTATVLAMATATVATAAIRSQEKVLGSPTDEQALVYLIRPKEPSMGLLTIFAYADRTFIGSVENGSYTFSLVDPGAHFLWMNTLGASQELTLDAGKTYYLVIGQQKMYEVDEDVAKAFIDDVEWYCTPEAKERAKGARQAAKRYAKARRVAAKRPTRRPREVFLKRFDDWPVVDLSGYHTLCIARFELTDPKASSRKWKQITEMAPVRLATLVATGLEGGPFEEVVREPVKEPDDGCLRLELEITQYKPGSGTARFLVVGAGAAHLDFVARLVDSATGEEVGRFSDEWTELGNLGIQDMDRIVAAGIARHLRRCARSH